MIFLQALPTDHVLQTAAQQGALVYFLVVVIIALAFFCWHQIKQVEALHNRIYDILQQRNEEKAEIKAHLEHLNQAIQHQNMNNLQTTINIMQNKWKPEANS